VSRTRAWAAAVAVVVSCTLGLGLLLDSDATPSPPPAAVGLATHFPRLGRVAVLVLENREYRDVMGVRRTPYLTQLARRYALASRYYALGHPSLPNYLALTAGSTFDVRRDCNGCDFEQPSILTQLDSAGISWKAYFEGLPRTGYLGTRHGWYSKHLNPFVYYESLAGHSADRSRIVPLRQLDRDLGQGRVPRFLWIAPNLCHDSHYCSVTSSDSYAARLVPGVLRALGPRGVLFVTWDEGTTHAGAHGAAGGGHVPLIAAGPAARRGAVMRTIATHYSLLRTVEAGLGLPALGQAGAPSTPLLGALLGHQTRN
jgi:phosphatidylinositol-3-phosphatase